jgi:hypothetical protein
MTMRFARRSNPILVVLASLSLTACVTLMAPYDDKIDEMATSLQRKVSTEIETLSGAEKPACLYPNHAAFYDEARVDVSALALRANAHEMNRQTIAQIEDLRGALDSWEGLHKLATARERCMQPAEFSPLQRGFDQITGAIVKLEIAKKRGK